MPEGDTAWRTAFHVHQALSSAQLVSTDFRTPRFATVDLADQVFVEATSVGKHLLFRTESYTVHSHLKMEGSWHLYRQPNPRWIRPAHSARAVLTTAQWQAVGFSLGKLTIVPRDKENDVIGHLGPDVITADFDVDAGVSRLLRNPDRPIFLALHDQRNISGWGNEYVNEMLFLHRTAPTRTVSSVDNLTELVQLGHRLIRSNAQHAVRSFTGNRRRHQTHWVFSRERRPCLRCDSVIQLSGLGDKPTQVRNVFWCPGCQF